MSISQKKLLKAHQHAAIGDLSLTLSSGLSLIKYQPVLSLAKTANSSSKPLRVLYVSSFVPRKCGIATFTRDLVEAIDSFNYFNQGSIMALVDDVSANLDYPKEVKFKVHQNNWSDYQKVIDHINTEDDFDLICLQHEFGIFGGQDGSFVLPFIKGIKKPIVSVLHSVSNPTPSRRKILQQIAQRSTSVIVMMESAAQIMETDYQVPRSKLEVIPHGVPTFPKFNIEKLKTKFDLQDKVVMTSINLISEWKGLQYAIASLPEIIKGIPNFIYLIIGQTHQGFINRLGGYDYYREHLEVLADTLGVSDSVRFVNEYVSLEELVEYVAVSDFYVTPYLYPEQTSSGALAYALGGGKVCISTPYRYASEVLSNNRGILVPFEDSQAISKAVIEVFQNPDQKQLLQKNAYRLGKTMTWDLVASQYLAVFESANILNPVKTAILQNSPQCLLDNRGLNLVYKSEA